MGKLMRCATTLTTLLPSAFFLELGRVNPSRAKENALLAHHHPITNLQIKYGDMEREERA